jgi:hypothetical protein
MSLSRDWVKSSYSDPQGGNCVEARQVGMTVQVRDSKDPAGGVLTFTATGWQALAAALKDGR